MAPESKPAETKQSLVGLPLMVASPVDIGRLLRELEKLDDDLVQAGLRGSELKMPKTSLLMDQTVQLNRLNLLEKEQRVQLMELLTNVKERAPVLHISFSADPAPAFIEKMMAWLRREIHPLLLLTVGLQPNIGAGCVVRSLNHHFDFSLRQDFLKKRDLLMAKLAEEGKTT